MTSICFIANSIPFDVSTPYKEPLGGTESAVSYLLIELAKLDCKVTLLSQNTHPTIVHNVDCRNINVDGTKDFFDANQFDAVVLVSDSQHIRPLKEHFLPPNTRLFFWAHHDNNQVAVASLADESLHQFVTKFIFISRYQQQQYLTQFKIDINQSIILPNGLAPCFENLFASESELAKAKENDIATYISTPFRGLNLLYHIASHPMQNLQYHIFSSMRVYQADDAEYQDLFNALKQCPQTQLHGSLPQAELAERLKYASFLTYPNTFPETFCISAIESVAAGLEIVSSNIGALPEICGAYGTFITPQTTDDWANQYLNEFWHTLNKRLQFKQTHFDQWCAQRYANAIDVQQKYSWKKIALTWRDLFA